MYKKLQKSLQTKANEQFMHKQVCLQALLVVLHVLVHINRSFHSFINEYLSYSSESTRLGKQFCSNTQVGSCKWGPLIMNETNKQLEI